MEYVITNAKIPGSSTYHTKTILSAFCAHPASLNGYLTFLGIIQMNLHLYYT